MPSGPSPLYEARNWLEYEELASRDLADFSWWMCGHTAAVYGWYTEAAYVGMGAVL